MTVRTPHTKHPAKYSDTILRLLGVLIHREARRAGRPIRVLDPFAGVGRVHTLAAPGRIETVGIEIEPPWAACHSDTIEADSLAWMRDHAADGWEPFDVIATSPTYGNRMADSHDARDGSERRSYKHDLGHDPHPDSSATLHWGPRYWAFHAEAWRLVHGVLRPAGSLGEDDPGGLFLLNVSDFVRQTNLVHATEWHDGACWAAGFTRRTRDRHLVETRRNGHGENREARAAHEVVFAYRRPEAT